MEARDVTERPPAPELLRDLKHIVLQHLRAEGYTEAAHSLERETRLYLDAEYVADLARRGAWDEAERYVGAFAGRAGKDLCSACILFALRRRKDIEALDRRVASKEGELLVNDLKAVAPYDEEAAKLMAALEDFRQRERLETASARDAVAVEIKKLIEANPLFQDKLEFPSFENSRLRVLINQSINYQHSLCKKNKNPEVGTLFNDHSCDSEIILCIEPKQITKSDLKPKAITKTVGIARPAAYPRFRTQFSGRMTNDTPSLPHVVAKKTPSLVQPPMTSAFPKHPTIPTGAPDVEYPMKRICFGQPDKVVGLLYLDAGMSLLALSSNATHKLWECQYNDRNHRKLWHLANGINMKNLSHGNTEEATACMALPKNGSCVLSASGGKVCVLNTKTFQIVSTFLAPPPAATFIAFHPQDNFIIAFGMEDSTIQIYNMHVCQVTNKLKAHHKKVTGLSFSQLKNVLVSSGADAQLCVWSIDDWEKKDSRYMIQHPNHSGSLDGDTKVQFHNDCQHFLVVNESQLAIYDWKLECLSLWSPGNELQSRISSAVFSCDGLLVYAGFCDGTIKIFQGDLNKVFCNVEPTDCVQRPLSSAGNVYPMVIAAHPSEPNQIALGMSDGEVIVVGLNIQTWTLSWGQCLPRKM